VTRREAPFKLHNSEFDIQHFFGFKIAFRFQEVMNGEFRMLNSEGSPHSLADPFLFLNIASGSAGLGLVPLFSNPIMFAKDLCPRDCRQDNPLFYPSALAA
jgi:hypothetical protein